MVNQAGEKTTRVLNLGTILSLSLLATLALALFIFMRQESQKADYDRYLAAATEQQVLTHQIDKYAVESGSGVESSFVKLRSARDDVSTLAQTLIEGDAENGLPPSPEAIQPKLQEMQSAWEVLKSHVDSILLSQSVIVRADRVLGDMSNRVPLLIDAAQQASTQLAQSGSTQQVYYSTRLLYLAQHVQTSLNQVLEGGPTTVLALDNLSQYTDELEAVVFTLRDGDEDANVKAVRSEEITTHLDEVAAQSDEIARFRDELLGMIGVLLPAVNALGQVENATSDTSLRQSGAAEVMSVASENLVAIDEELKDFYRSSARTIDLYGIPIGPQVAWLLFAIAAILLGVLVFIFITQRNRATQAALENERNQTAIRKLLREMGGLGDGDLSIEATVTDDITGAIADSINLAVESMRDVVFSINDTANNVSDATRRSQYLSSELTNAAKVQVQDVSQASDVGESMVVALEELSEKAKRLSDITIHSYELAGQGGRAVNQNVEAMGNLREQIQGTSKRIKRLGESSQEIGSIVGLIMGITDQTNILAMNASMQAATAGEAGRGFSLVADELQRLAERSARATKQIETLINAIQADTSEAVSSMEASISNVLDGARLAEQAGGILDQIEKVSRDVTDSTKDMSNSAELQSNKAATMRSTMLSVRELTDKMSEDIASTNKGTLFLAKNVLQLQKSVAEFTLPDRSASAEAGESESTATSA